MHLFASAERVHCAMLFRWYNTVRRHSGVGYMTPHSMHYGLAADLPVASTATLGIAFLDYPKRFRNKASQPPILPNAAWINPPKEEVPVTPNSQPCTLNS